MAQFKNLIVTGSSSFIGNVQCLGNDKSIKIGNASYSAGLRMDSAGINRGLYDFTLNDWMVYADGSKVYLKGNAETATTLSSTLAVGKGGTGTTVAPKQGGIIYGASTSAYGCTAAGSSGQLLISQGTGAPAWTAQSNIAAGSATKDGSGNTITSTYLKLSGGTMTGPIIFSNASGNTKTSNYLSAGGGYSTGSGRLGLKLVACDQSDIQAGIGIDLTGSSYETCLSTGRNADTGTSYITFATHTTGTTAYKRLGHFTASGGVNPTVDFNVNGTISLLSKARMSYNSTDNCIEFTFV